MKSFFLPLLIFATCIARAASPTISDSLDILHTTIDLTVTDYAGQTIQGKAELLIEAKVDGINTIPLDLLQLNVDSVWIDGSFTSFTQIGELISISTGTVMNTGDQRTISVFYGGEPDRDITWGGWYWSGEHAYQMGVGFIADPHNYGRIWFPCFDNFIERCTFTFHITTPENYKAFCGGVLTDESTNADGTTTWTWELNQAIPSYLASVAVSTYSTVSWNYEGLLEDIPVEIGVQATDSIKLKNSFVHLDDAMAAYESSYGPYMWDRVGYVIVPFGGGAMEHACNIAYPSFAIDNTTNWELLMAHELSHHWWGNLITCSDATEMWLNEGWASFSEYLFLEKVYGRAEYDQAVAEDHLEIISYGFANDGGNYFPLAEMPHDYTYGFTTYTRGAMTVHNLRGYMGDDMFFDCITEFLQAYAFQPVSSETFRDYLTSCSVMDMDPFFEGWIFNAGTPAVEIDYHALDSNGHVNICLEQKLNHAPEYFQDYPVEIFLVSSNGQTLYKEKVFIEAPSASVSISAPVDLPDDFAVILDRDNLVADAVTADEIYLTSTGSHDLDNTLMDITVNALSGDTDWIRIEHYWVGADGLKEPVAGVQTNNQRYWRVMGDYNGDQTNASIKFNGTNSISSGYLDNEFITNSDDSLLLFFRVNPEDDWEEYGFYELDPWGNHSDKRGQFNLSKVFPGEYAFGQYDVTQPDASPDLDACDYLVGLEQYAPVYDWKIFPNPSVGLINVYIPAKLHGGVVEIYSPDGQLLDSRVVEEEIQTFTLQDGVEGLFLVSINDPSGRPQGTQKVLIIR